MDAGLTVPTIFTDSQVSVQDNEGQSSHISDSLVANPVLVPVGPGIDMRLSPHFTIVGDVANQPYGDASPITGSKDLHLDRLAFVRQQYGSLGVSTRVSALLLEGSRDNTNKTYQSPWKSWNNWSDRRSCDPSLTQVLDYLNFLFDSGKSYRTINLHRSMPSVLSEAGRFEYRETPFGL